MGLQKDFYDIELVWSEVDIQDLDRYEVWRNDHPWGVGDWRLVGKPKSSRFTDKNVPFQIPTEGYYYTIYAVDKLENFSGPSSPVYKTSPMDSIVPATPVGLTARRTDSYEAVDLSWNDIEAVDKKGYIVWRTLDPLAITPTWEVIALTSSSKYKDSEIPRGNDAVLRVSEVSYFIESYDTSGNISAPTSATAIFTIPLLRGLRASLDYLSVNVFWNEPLPEDDIPAVAIYMRKVGETVWYLQGVTESPKNFLRIDGPLLPFTDYEILAGVVTSGLHQLIELDGTLDDVYVTGDQTSLFSDTDSVQIAFGGTLNGTYTLNAAPSFSAGATKLQFAENLTIAPTVNGGDITNGYFLVSGDHVAEYPLIDKTYIYIFGSTGNLKDGRYTLSEASLNPGDPANTRLYVEETIPAGTWDGQVTSGKIYNNTTIGLQVPIILVPVPNYETDIILPTTPLILKSELDPANERIFLNWNRYQAEDDFLDFHVDISTVGDFDVVSLQAAGDYFEITGDQTAYFYVGQRIYQYDSTNNDGWWTVTAVLFVGGKTRLTIDGEVNDAVVDGTIVSDLAWILMDKTRNTNFQAYFPYVVSDTYYHRVRAVDRSGNKSLPALCQVSNLWDNTDLTGPAADALFVPQWIYVTIRYAATPYKIANNRQYQITSNDGPELSKFFKAHVLFFVHGTAGHGTPWTLFSLTKTEILSVQESNRFTWETNVSGASSIYVWPAILDTFNNIWVGPTSSVQEITNI